MAFLELTLNSDTGLWHPHLHVLFEGSFLPLAVARLAWHRITKDSYIVDIRDCKNAQHACGYVAKYAGKALPSNITRSHEHLAEAVGALHGRRLFNTFGSWSRLKLSRPPESDTPWETVCSLEVILSRAERGDEEALHILAALGRTNPCDSNGLLGSDTS